MRKQPYTSVPPPNISLLPRDDVPTTQHSFTNTT